MLLECTPRELICGLALILDELLHDLVFAFLSLISLRDLDYEFQEGFAIVEFELTLDGLPLVAVALGYRRKEGCVSQADGVVLVVLVERLDW